jgi:hypothetical protein
MTISAIVDEDEITLSGAVSVTNITCYFLLNPAAQTCTTTQGSCSISIGSGLDTITTGMMVSSPTETSVIVPNNTIVTSVQHSGATTYIVLSNPTIPTAESYSLKFSPAVEIVSEGSFNFYNSTTNTPLNVFIDSDISLPLYMSPDSAANFVSPGTQGTAPQLTTNRPLAASSGQPLLEIGVVTSLSSAFVDIEGDVRGTTGLSQITPLAGEYMEINDIPTVVSMGSDGYIYIADKQKSKNTKIAILNTDANTCGTTVGSYTYPQVSIATFTVLTGSTPGGTLTWSGTGTGTVTIPAVSTTTDVAEEIANYPPTTWTVVSSVASQVTMIASGVVDAPTLGVAATGITITAINVVQSYEGRATTTITGSASSNGIITINGVTTTITDGSVQNAIASAIASSFSTSPVFSVSASTNILTFTQISNPNRNTPIGVLVGANTGFDTDVPALTPCVVQKVGTITNAAWTTLIPGYPIYNGLGGLFTTDLASLSYYNDVASPIGYTQSADSIYVNI